MIELKRTTSDNEDFRLLAKELDKDLRSCYKERQAVYYRDNIVENKRKVVMAYKDEIALACGV